MAEGIVKTNGRILYAGGVGSSYLPGVNVTIDGNNVINACEDFRIATYNETDTATMQLWQGLPILVRYQDVLYMPTDAPNTWQIVEHSYAGRVVVNTITWSEADGWQFKSEIQSNTYRAGYGLALENNNTFRQADKKGAVINQDAPAYYDLGSFTYDTAYYGQAAIRIDVTYDYGYEATFYMQFVRAINGHAERVWCIGSNKPSAKDYIQALYIVQDDTNPNKYLVRLKVSQETTSTLFVQFGIADSSLSTAFKAGKYTAACVGTRPPDLTNAKRCYVNFYGGGGGGGTTYDAGKAIIISGSTISVNVGKGLEVDANNKLQVKLGKGLKFDTDAGIEGEISLDNTSQDVIEEVQTLTAELDKKITTTFNYAQITASDDFAPYGVTGTTRMIGQLFAVPISSEIRENDTLICVRAKQKYEGNVSFGIFEFDFDGNEGTGSTTWLCDTGKVKVDAGENQFSVKHILPTNTVRPTIKMEPGKLYYATVMIDGNAPTNGLNLASCEPYDQNYNATPKYTLVASNLDNYVDWTNGSQRNAWFQGYNEMNTIPRLFMMIRNGEASPIVTVDPFTDIGEYTLSDNYAISDFFNLTISSNYYPVLYQKIMPSQECVITKIGWIDTHATSTYESAGSDIPLILDDTYTSLTNVGNNTEIATTQRPDGFYYHEFQLASPLTALANSIYYVPADFNVSTSDDKLITYATPSQAKKDLLLFASKWNVSTWAGDNAEYVQGLPGTCCTITTADNKTYTF